MKIFSINKNDTIGIAMAEISAAMAITGLAIENDSHDLNPGLRDIFGTIRPKTALKWCRENKITPEIQFTESWDNKKYYPSEKAIKEVVNQFIKLGYFFWI